MSKNHKSPPFTITSEEAANIIYKKLGKTGVVMANYKILLSKIVLIVFPQKFIDRF